MGRLSDLMKKFFDNAEDYQDGDLPEDKNFLQRLMDGKPTTKEINKKLLRKKKIKLNRDGLLGGLRKRNELMQKQLDEAGDVSNLDKDKDGEN